MSNAEEKMEPAHGITDEQHHLQSTEVNEPLQRRILSPGVHLLNVAFEREVEREIVVEGLQRVGFSRVSIDEAHREIPARAPVSIAASLARPVRLVNTAAVRWLGVRTLTTDPFRELAYKLVPFALEEGRLYEMILITRMKSHPTRERVVEILSSLRGAAGFSVDDLLVLQRDVRVPGHPDTSAAVWFGIGRWSGPPSYANMDDPISFESVVESPET